MRLRPRPSILLGLALNVTLGVGGCIAEGPRFGARALDVAVAPELVAPDAGTSDAAARTELDAPDGPDVVDPPDVLDPPDTDLLGADATTTPTDITHTTTEDAVTGELPDLPDPPDVPEPPDPPDLQALGRAIDDYLDHRWDGAPEATDDLVATLEQSGASLDAIEDLIRGGRQSYPDVSALVGTTSQRPITCDHVAYASSYLLSVPASYAPSTPTPVVVVAHGGAPATMADAATAALDALESYRDPFLARGMIVIAPLSTRGWSPIGDSVVFTALSDLQRSFHIDPDRIYVAGHLVGGHMAWRSAITHGDRYAAFAPASGGYVTWPGDGRLRNLFGSRGFQTWCATEPNDLRAANLGIRTWLVNADYPWQARDLAGTSHVPEEVLPDIADLFMAVRRGMYPSQVFLTGGGTMRYDANWAGQTEAIDATRAYRWNQRRWLELDPNPAAGGVLDALATVVDAHTIRVVSNRVRSFRLWLHPDMGLDLDQPIRVIVNDEVRWDGPVETDLGAMLELVREWDDRGRIYRAHVEVKVETDREVGTPVGAPDDGDADSPVNHAP